MISTPEITSKLSILNLGGTNASGLRVLSDEYSYPISTILTLLIFPMSFDVIFILAPVPFVLDTVLNNGSFL